MRVEELAKETSRSPGGNLSRWFEKFLADTKDASTMPDEQELARRRELLHRIDALRAEIRKRHGIHPDSTLMIREMRDNE